MKAKNLFKVALVALLFWAGQGSVMAGMVVYEDIGFMSQNETPSQLESFTISNAGAYQIKLMDFSFPESFKSLGVLIARDASDGYQEVVRLNTQGEKVVCTGMGPTVPTPIFTPGFPGPACGSQAVPFQCWVLKVSVGAAVVF